MAHTTKRAGHDAKRGLAEWQRRVAVDIAAAFPLVAIRASGNHLAAQNDEPEPMECGDITPSEAEFAKADLDYLARRQENLHKQWDAVGQMELDALRRQGYL